MTSSRTVPRLRDETPELVRRAVVDPSDLALGHETISRIKVDLPSAKVNSPTHILLDVGVQSDVLARLLASLERVSRHGTTVSLPLECRVDTQPGNMVALVRVVVSREAGRRVPELPVSAIPPSYIPSSYAPSRCPACSQARRRTVSARSI